jgi:hypothetical protein
VPPLTPPPGWHANSSGRPLAHWVVQQVHSSGAPAAAAAAGAGAGSSSSGSSSSDGVLRVYGCLVKSEALPLRLQAPLQQDRWCVQDLPSLQPPKTRPCHRHMPAARLHASLLTITLPHTRAHTHTHLHTHTHTHLQHTHAQVSGQARP